MAAKSFSENKKAALQGAYKYAAKKWDGKSSSLVATVLSVLELDVVGGKGEAKDVVKFLKNQLPEGTSERKLLHKQIKKHEKLARSGAKGVTKRKNFYNHTKDVVKNLANYITSLGDIDNIRKGVRVRLGIEDKYGNEMDGNPTMADLDRLIANDDDMTKIFGHCSVHHGPYYYNKGVVYILGSFEVRQIAQRDEEQNAKAPAQDDSNAGRLQKNTTGNAVDVGTLWDGDDGWKKKEEEESAIIKILLTETEQLETECKRLQGEREKLSKKNKDWKETLSDLGRDNEKDSEKYEYKIGKLEKKITELQMTVSELEEKVNNGNTACEEISQKQEEMKREVIPRIERTRKQIDDALHSINELEKMKNGLEKEMKVLVTDLVKDYNEKNLQKAISDNVDGVTKKTELWQAVEGFETRRAKIAKKLADMRTLTDDYKTKLVRLRDDIAKIGNKIEEEIEKEEKLQREEESLRSRTFEEVLIFAGKQLEDQGLQIQFHAKRQDLQKEVDEKSL